jgi:polyribonucleotide nucleotidyltransferase
MDNLSTKTELINAFSNVRSFSFEQKKAPLLDEENINAVLDAILDFKTELKEKSKRIQLLNDRLESITWLNNLDEECLMLLNDLISSAKDLRTTLIRQYIAMNLFRAKGIAKEEIKDFKISIDLLKEAYEDLESVFFFLPEMPDFKETTKKLSLI